MGEEGAAFAANQLVLEPPMETPQEGLAPNLVDYVASMSPRRRGQIFLATS